MLRMVTAEKRSAHPAFMRRFGAIGSLGQTCRGLTAFHRKGMPVPHFFMHLRHGSETIKDLEGEEFASLGEARDKAIAAAREIMSDRVGKGQEPDGSAVLIVDENGSIAMVVPFEDAIDWPDRS